MNSDLSQNNRNVHDVMENHSDFNSNQIFGNLFKKYSQFFQILFKN